MGLITGYTGIYRQPYANGNNYGDSIYVITDVLHQELNMIILSPGFFMDVYRIASSMSYQRLNVFIPSVDELFISDLFRLVLELSKLKKHIQWVYPDKITTVIPNALFSATQVIKSKFVISKLNKGNQVFTVEYMDGMNSMLSPGHMVYDIKVVTNDRVQLFCTYLSEEKLKTLSNSGKIDDIHAPYNAVYYGGQSLRQCLARANYPKFPALVANNLNCREEFMECTTRPDVYPGQRAPLTSV